MSTNIQGLLERMTNADKDFRFMATNDLMGELQKDGIQLDEEIERKITFQIISLLQDQNGEVQNLAVKCLGNLIKRVRISLKQVVIQSLCQMLRKDSEQIRDIASIALKTIVVEIPVNRRTVEILEEDLNPNLILAIDNGGDINVQLESLDILTELINRFGSQLNQHHEQMQQHLLNQLESDRSAVRKRSMNALSYLLTCCSDTLFNKTISQLAQTLEQEAPKSEADVQARFSGSPTNIPSKTLLQCLATIIRVAGHRTNIEQLNQLMPVIYSFCQVKDDELKEFCLQAFEAFVKRSPVNINASLRGIIEVCISNISHDPNYNYDEDETDYEFMEMDNTDDEDDASVDDYSDDDDLSWKVRRACAKCLEAIIVSRRDMLNDFFLTIGPVLVSRFKEREDSVKADIIQTFVALLKQTRAVVNESKGSQQPLALSKLSEMIPVIVAKSATLLREKSVKTRQTVFPMFTEVMNIIPNALNEYIATLLPGVLHSIVDKNSTSNMKIDALLFVQELIKTHEPTTFHPHIHTILPAVISAVDDSFYKTASEALMLLSLLVCVIRPANQEPMPDHDKVLNTIYEKTREKMARTDVDIEIKERALSCMGQIIATFGDKLQQQLPIALDMFHEKLEHDSTRLTCVKALIKIANSPLPMSLSHIFPRAFSTLATFLRKTSRPLRISTLVLIENVVRRSGDLLEDEASQAVILADTPSLIVESDLYVSQLALTMLTTIIKTKRTCHPIIAQQVLPRTLQLVRSPLLQGSALKAMLQFFDILVNSTMPNLDHKSLLSSLVEPIYNSSSIHKQAFSSTAKAVAAISIGNSERTFSTVVQLIQDSKTYAGNDSVFTLVLLSIGEIGRVVDLGNLDGLVEVILHAFESSSEDVKSAGSYALGCVAVGNLDKFLPIILHEIESRNKRQYLILHSLREVIAAGRLEQLGTVWTLLMKHCECQEEGTRNVVSECLGKLILLKPKELLERLIKYLTVDYVDKPLARSTIVAAIKFTISDQPQEVDTLLQQCMGEFLQALKDQDINVRRVALITFNSAAHNKPSLIVNLLPKILPLLYAETSPKYELIREVEMGPFKHRVDDGLDSRKAAFECMYTLLDTCQNQLDIFEFLTHVEHGLRDHYDIKMLTYLMLNRLAALCPSAVLQRMDRLIDPIESVCVTKPKENAVKQEHEKQDELKRSALRAFDALRSIPNADRHPVVVKFYEDLIKADKNLLELYSSIHRDNSAPNDNIHKMDLS